MAIFCAWTRARRGSRGGSKSKEEPNALLLFTGKEESFEGCSLVEFSRLYRFCFEMISECCPLCQRSSEPLLLVCLKGRTGLFSLFTGGGRFCGGASLLLSICSRLSSLLDRMRGFSDPLDFLLPPFRVTFSELPEELRASLKSSSIWSDRLLPTVFAPSKTSELQPSLGCFLDVRASEPGILDFNHSVVKESTGTDRRFPASFDGDSNLESPPSTEGARRTADLEPAASAWSTTAMLTCRTGLPDRLFGGGPGTTTSQILTRSSSQKPRGGSSSTTALATGSASDLGATSDLGAIETSFFVSQITLSSVVSIGTSSSSSSSANICSNACSCCWGFLRAIRFADSTAVLLGPTFKDASFMKGLEIQDVTERKSPKSMLIKPIGATLSISLKNSWSDMVWCL